MTVGPSSVQLGRKLNILVFVWCCRHDQLRCFGHSRSAKLPWRSSANGAAVSGASRVLRTLCGAVTRCGTIAAGGSTGVGYGTTGTRVGATGGHAVIALLRPVDDAVAAVWAQQASGFAATVRSRVESRAEITLFRAILDAIATIGT